MNHTFPIPKIIAMPPNFSSSNRYRPTLSLGLTTIVQGDSNVNVGDRFFQNIDSSTLVVGVSIALKGIALIVTHKFREVVLLEGSDDDSLGEPAATILRSKYARLLALFLTSYGVYIVYLITQSTVAMFVSHVLHLFEYHK